MPIAFAGSVEKRPLIFITLLRCSRMLRNYYINREWVLSATARRIYLAAASMSLLFFVTLLSVQTWMALQPTDHVPEILLPFLKLALFPGVLGTAVTLVAMEYFLFSFDDSGALKKTFWFCAMLLPSVGPPLYCFFVYSRAEPFRNRSASAKA